MISNQGAALMIKEENLINDFEDQFCELISSKNLQEKLKKNIKKLSKPLATEKIVDEIKILLKA